jgi:hypothetical protein
MPDCITAKWAASRLAVSSMHNYAATLAACWPQSFRASEVELLIVLMPGFGSGVGLLSAAGRAAVPGMPGCAPAPTAPG